MIELTLLALGAALILLVAGQRIENQALKNARAFKERSTPHRHTFFKAAYKNFPQRKGQPSKVHETPVHVSAEGHLVPRRRS